MNRVRIRGLGIALAVAASAACSSSSPSGSGSQDGGASALCYKPAADPIQDGHGHALKSFTPPCDPGSNSFAFSISGETNAIVGYSYPPYDPATATYMVDGWNWKINEFIVVIDHITLWSNPNASSSDQSQHGPTVAHVDGPFVVDLHKGGPLDGKGGAGEQALALAALANQNDNGGSGFDPSTTYAFGFSTVSAPGDGSAINVNLTKDEEADYQYMVQHGASVYYHGTAQWNGNQSGGQTGFGLCSSNPQTDYTNMAQTCASATPASGGDGGTGGGGAGGSTCPNVYDFSKLPQTMSFQLAFPTPTNYVNCVNYSTSQRVGHDVRGVQSSSSQTEIEQITVHMDHPFWESFQENTPVHWDQVAARYVGQTNPTAHLDDMKGVPFKPFTDENGGVLPWHWCESMYSPPGNGAMSFDTLSVMVDPQGTCTGTLGQDAAQSNCKVIRDYYDFMKYTQSTQGHLNSQGICFVDRQYPAPAGGS
jgi:hypothetical protein